MTADYSSIHARKTVTTVEKYMPLPSTRCTGCGAPLSQHDQPELRCQAWWASGETFDPDRSTLTPAVETHVSWLTPDNQEVTDQGAIADLERRLSERMQEGQ